MFTSKASLLLSITLLSCFMLSGSIRAQDTPRQGPLLADNDSILVTVFLKHDQTMNNAQRRELLDESGFNDIFPPDGVEIVDHYVMMGIGQVIVLRLPPDHLRRLNIAIENGAWGAYQTEFYITYDLAAARLAEKSR